MDSVGGLETVPRSELRGAVDHRRRESNTNPLCQLVPNAG